MIPIINGFKQKYNIQKLIVVADSGLLSKTNVNDLMVQKHEFILGARIKTEVESIKKKNLSLYLKNAESSIIKKGDLKLIITYSDQRAKKDKYNCEKGVKRLEKNIKTGALTKNSINNRG